MGVPLALGGLETDPLTTLRVLEEVSRLDSAAGWNLMISQASPSFCAWLPAEVSGEIFEGHPDSILAGALTPPGRAVPVEGRISGHGTVAICLRV
jgi:indole-3-acetate monooxygenase